MRGQLSLELLLLMSAMLASLTVMLPLAARLGSASAESLGAQGANYVLRHMNSLCRKAELLGPGFSESFDFLSPATYQVSENMTHYSIGAIAVGKKAQCTLPHTILRGRNHFVVRNDGEITIVDV